MIVGIGDAADEQGQEIANYVPVPGFAVAYSGLSTVADYLSPHRKPDPAYVERRRSEGAADSQIVFEWLASLGIYGAPIPLVPPPDFTPDRHTGFSEYDPIRGPLSARLQQDFARQEMVAGSEFVPVGPVSARLTSGGAFSSDARSSPSSPLVALGVVGLAGLAWWFLRS